MTFQTTSVKRSIIVKANIDRVWAALTAPAELMRWETVACEFDARLGGKSKRDFGWGVQSSGTVVEIEEKRKIVIQDDEDGSQVIWTLEPVSDGIEVAIEYTGLWTGDLEHSMAENMGFGTYQFLVNLKTVLETGIDIRKQLWRSWLGITHTTIRPDHRDEFHADHGTLVLKVSAGSAASEAGIQPGDVILSVNGHPVASYSELEGMATSRDPGEIVDLGILRDGQQYNAEVRLGKFPIEYIA
jgi:uncharacterized protein YndB with AHSA1/START domain